MTSELAVHVYEDVDDAALQLHVRPGAGAHCVLFDWKLPPTHIDAGPPAAVADALAAALVACGTLAFLETPPRRDRRVGWFADGGDAWLPVPPSLGDRLLRRLPPWFRATDSAERAIRLFDGSVSWGQQSQIGLLLRRDSRPWLDRAFLLKVLRARSIDVAELRLPADILALALPAVDGDYLELISPRRHHARRRSQCDRRRVRAPQHSVRASLVAACHVLATAPGHPAAMSRRPASVEESFQEELELIGR